MSQPIKNKLPGRRGRTFLRTPVALVLGFVVCGAGGSLLFADAENTASSQQLYNDGTQKLKDGKLQEAEACLQSAVTSQDASVQPRALYNLGEVRFKEGAEDLKKGPNPRAVQATAQDASDSGDSAIRAVDEALAGTDQQAMIEAYFRGRGARKELKGAMEAVKRAMESYGGVLAHWQRASGDFKSTYELTPSDADAKTNADLVDLRIARLVDQQQMMMMSMNGMAAKRDELGKKLGALKKKIPSENGDKPGGRGDDDDDDDGKPKLPQKGQEEPGPKNGKEMQMSPEEASRLLDMLKLDGTHKLPLGTNDLGKPGNRSGRDW